MRQSRRSLLLVVVFAMGLFTLLLLTALRTDLINRWQASVPTDAPNCFLINIQANEQAPLELFSAEPITSHALSNDSRALSGN